MSMSGIAKYMHLSQTIDLRREKECYLQLPDGRASRSMLMNENKAATFSSACSRRVLAGGWLG